MPRKKKLEEAPVPAAAVEETPVAEVKPRKKLGRVIGLGVGLFLVITVIGGLAGYAAGIQVRRSAEQNQRLLAASLQFQLGVEDLTRGNYDFAQKRFNYVLQLDPSYPGVMEKLAELSIIMNATATPTPQPVSTPVPTLDTSGVASLYNQVQQFLLAKDWDSAIAGLDAMRKENPAYKTLKVDGLYYVALRNRGIQKIQAKGKLEQGIFDIYLMSKYGPIDKEARDAEEWARYYIFGAAWYKANWDNVLRDLQVVYANYPNLTDQNGMTAGARYWTALYSKGAQLLTSDRVRYACDASSYLEQAYAMNPKLPAEVENQRNQSARDCAYQKNMAPGFTTPADLGTYPGTAPWVIAISAADPEGDPISVTLAGTDLPAEIGNVGFDGTTLSITPGASYVPGVPATYKVTLQVSDGREDHKVLQEFTFILP